MFDMMVI